MSKQTRLIIGAIGVVVILAIGGFVLANRSSTSSQVIPSVSPVSQPTQEALRRGALKDLLAAGKTVSCLVSYPDQNGSGEVYVSGTKFRGNFTTKVNDKVLISHMISDNGTTYIWTEGTSQGTKIKIDPQNFSPPPGGQSQTTDLNKEVDFKCVPWSTDSSQFSVPTNVTFTDLTQTLKQIPSNGASGLPKVDKSVCDNISDSQAKAACLKALGGN